MQVTPRQRSPRGPGRGGARAGGDEALVLFGLDNLRTLEDLFGQRLGEEVIGAVETRMARILPPRTRLWRAEHRRLAVTARGLDRTGLSALIARLQTAIAHQPIVTAHGPVAVTVSAGCAIDSEGDGVSGDSGGESNADNAEEARLAAARLALSEAMAAGVGCIRFTEQSGNVEEQKRHMVAAAQFAMGALRTGDLVIAFQPVVSAEGNHRAAFHECLVRIRDKQGQPIPAGRFMPAMERLGLAPLIDRQVLILALDTLNRQPGTRLSINIYPQTMQDTQWMMLFDEGTRYDPSLAERLIVEITETAAMLEPARTRAFMNRLRDRGVAFALDDFGMGHTSFGSLRDFRFDLIKIDGSFITDVATNPDNRFFVAKLVEIARHFDMVTVAEFVQGAGDARILADLGVELFQGFYFGTPSLVLGAGPQPESVAATTR